MPSFLSRFFKRSTPITSPEKRSLSDISAYAAASAALNSVASVSTTAGVPITEQTSLTLPSVFACVRNIADDISKCERAVFRHLDRGKVQLYNHPIHRLINVNPNPECGPMDFLQAIMTAVLIYGNGYARIIRDRYTGMPTALYPIHPWRVRMYQDSTNMLFYSIDGASDKIADQYNGRVELNDMFHVKGFGINGVMGLRTVFMNKEALALGIAIQQYGASFFGNSAMPSGIFESDGELSQEAMERFREAWSARLRGVGRSHQNAVLPPGFKFHPISVANNEGQWMEAKAFSVLDVARIFRMPPHKIADVSKGTMNNMETQNGEYVQDCLMTWMVKIEEECRRKLTLPAEKDIYLKFLSTSFMRGDMKTRGDFWSQMRQWGIASQNEIREALDMNPIPGGDGFILPANFIASEALETMPRSKQLLIALAAKSKGLLDANGNLDTDKLLAMGDSNQPDQPTELDENIDPAQMAGPEDNAPAPNGIHLPGSMPTDDIFLRQRASMERSSLRGSASISHRCHAIIAAQTPLLEQAITRLLNLESDKITRGMKNLDATGVAPFVDAFYSSHRDYVRQSVAPILTAMARSVMAATDVPTGVSEQMDGFITGVVDSHVNASHKDAMLMDDESLADLFQKVKGWVENRPAQFVADQTSILLDLLLGKVNVGANQQIDSPLEFPPPITPANKPNDVNG